MRGNIYTATQCEYSLRLVYATLILTFIDTNEKSIPARISRQGTAYAQHILNFAVTNPTRGNASNDEQLAGISIFRICYAYAKLMLSSTLRYFVLTQQIGKLIFTSDLA